MSVEVGGRQIEGNGRFDVDNREALALADLVCGVPYGGLELRLLDRVDVIEHRFHGSEMLDELDGRLLTDAGDAGDVIGRVAFEGFWVRGLLGQDAVPHRD